MAFSDTFLARPVTRVRYSGTRRTPTSTGYGPSHSEIFIFLSFSRSKLSVETYGLRIGGVYAKKSASELCSAPDAVPAGKLDSLELRNSFETELL